MSKGYSEKDCGCKKEKEKEAEVLLKCKTGTPITVTLGDDATTNTVSTLTLKTSHFNDPCIKLEFASNIVAAPEDGKDLTLNFQVFKKCKGETDASKIGPVWTFARAGQLKNTTDTFTFIVCDCDCDCDCDKDDCCTYSVVVTTPAGGKGVANINNPILSAIVVEKNNRCQ